MKIGVVVPTCRPERAKWFLNAWTPLFQQHSAALYFVQDGDVPRVLGDVSYASLTDGMTGLNAGQLGIDDRYIFNRTDACRNLGFAFLLKHCGYCPDDIIITLDDDVLPIGDPIQEHLNVLAKRVPISWMSTVGPDVPYMRGFPYGVRTEAEVVFSHGVWHNVPDFDAITQLSHPELATGFTGPFYRGPVPSGALIPVCGMNVAFKVKALPWCYWAPMGPKTAGYGRWADIFMGIVAKRAFDKKDWAMWTGSASVLHTRASNVFANLEAEAKSIVLNEHVWESDDWPYKNDGEYSKQYAAALTWWQEFCAEHGIPA